MPNAFKDLRGLRPRLPALAYGHDPASRSAALLRPLTPRGTLAHLADVDLLDLRSPQYVPIEPVAIANPYEDHPTLCPLGYPEGLLYVVNGFWIDDPGLPHYHVGPPCAFAVEFVPPTPTGSSTVTLTLAGVTAYTRTFDHAEGRQADIFWMPDALFDSTPWPWWDNAGAPSLVPQITTSGGDFFHGFIIPTGGLVSASVPKGWTAVTEPETTVLQFGPEFRTAGGYQENLPPTLHGFPRFPLTLWTNSRRSGLAYTDATAIHSTHFSAWCNASTLPTIYSATAATEILSVPEYLGPGPGNLWPSDLGDACHYYGYGFIRTGNYAYDEKTAFDADVATPAFYDHFTRGFDLLSLMSIGDNSGTFRVVVNDYLTSETLFDDTISGSWSDGDLIPLDFDPPSTAEGGLWRISAHVLRTVDDEGMWRSAFVLRFRERFLPWPFAVPRADAVGVAPGATKASATRAPVSPFGAPGSLDVTTASGVLTHTFGDTTSTDSPIVLTFSGVPKGWYYPQVNGSDSSIVADGEYELGIVSGIYGSTLREARGNGLPFRWVVRASGSGNLNGSTYAIVRATIAHQAITLGSASWLQLTTARMGPGFASFTAPSAGAYEIEVCVSNGTPDTAANRWGQIARVEYSLTDPDVIGGTLLINPPASPIQGSLLTAYDAPSAGWSWWSGRPNVGVVGLSPTGVFAGHAGKVFGSTHSAKMDASDWQYYDPEDGLAASFGGRTLVAKGGAWPTDPVKATVQLAAGQTIYLRVGLLQPHLAASTAPDLVTAGTRCWIKARAVG